MIASPGRAWLLAALVLAGCAAGRNYLDPDGPRYAGGSVPTPSGTPDTLVFVSFNVEHGERVDSALAALAVDPAGRADVILLQEMDEGGTERLAAALGMAYVYYPARFRFGTERNFGNAVLSRWPIVDDAKILLPHTAFFGGTRRTATAATLQVGSDRIRVYSVHLATPVNMDRPERRDQLRAVLADARPYERVVIGGDMNGGGFGTLARAWGFAWPTEEGPRTLRWGRWDHLFIRGLGLPEVGASGTILDNRGASDHLPVWARGVLGG